MDSLVSNVSALAHVFWFRVWVKQIEIQVYVWHKRMHLPHKTEILFVDDKRVPDSYLCKYYSVQFTLILWSARVPAASFKCFKHQLCHCHPFSLLHIFQYMRVRVCAFARSFCDNYIGIYNKCNIRITPDKHTVCFFHCLTHSNDYEVLAQYNYLKRNNKYYL